MTCPRCQHQAISFTEWLRGRNAFSTICDHCGAHLRGNSVIWYGLSLTAALVILAIPLSGPILDAAGLDQAGYLARAAVVIPVAIFCTTLTWLLGGYEMVEPHPFIKYEGTSDAPAFQKKKPVSDVVVATFVILLFIGVPVVVVAVGWEDLLVVPFGIPTRAEVMEMDQSGGVLERQGDWSIAYVFEANGENWSGVGTLPPAKVRSDLEAVSIRYFRWRPSISKITSEISRTPFIALFVLIVGIVAYLRESDLDPE